MTDAHRRSALSEMPVNLEQAAEIDRKVEQVRKSVVKAVFAWLATADPSIRQTFEANRDAILNAIFPSGDGLTDLGLSYKAGRRIMDEISDALGLDPHSAIYPTNTPKF